MRKIQAEIHNVRAGRELSLEPAPADPDQCRSLWEPEPQWIQGEAVLVQRTQD